MPVDIRFRQRDENFADILGGLGQGFIQGRQQRQQSQFEQQQQSIQQKKLQIALDKQAAEQAEEQRRAELAQDFQAPPGTVFDPFQRKLISQRPLVSFSGIPGLTQPTSVIPGQQQAFDSFDTPEEADASGLPPGTIVTVQGRRYQI